jgi:phage host-nuclease inhibitor protein Gam
MGIRNPQSMEEVAIAINHITNVENTRKRNKANLEDAVATLKEKFAKEDSRLKAEAKKTKAAISSFMRSNKKSLLRAWEGLKSIELFSGTIGWRRSTVRISVKQGCEAEVGEQLIKLGAKHCVEKKVVYVIDRVKLRQHPDIVKKIPQLSSKGGKQDVLFIDPNPMTN